MKKYISILSSILAIASFVFLSSCISTTGTWNPEGQPESKLAKLQLINNTSTQYHIIAVDGQKLSKPFIAGEDNIKFSTGDHELVLGLVGSTGLLVGGVNYQDQNFILKVTAIQEPDTQYVLTWDYGFFGRTKTVISIKKLGFLFDTVIQEWDVELIGTNQWKITPKSL